MTSRLRHRAAVSTSLAAFALSCALGACSGDPAAPDSGHDAREAPDALEGADAFSAFDANPPGPDAFSQIDAPSGCGDACATSFDAGPGDAPSGADADVMENAFIARSCGPADGPALQLTISDFLDPSMCTADPLRASTMFYIHDLGGASLPPTAGATITSTAAASNGNATQCPGGSPPCRLSEEWSITFATYSDTGGATGQYTITWIGGEVSTGSFVATRCETGPILCG